MLIGLNSVYKLFLNIHKGTKPETSLFTLSIGFPCTIDGCLCYANSWIYVSRLPWIVFDQPQEIVQINVRHYMTLLLIKTVVCVVQLPVEQVHLCLSPAQLHSRGCHSWIMNLPLSATQALSQEHDIPPGWCHSCTRGGTLQLQVGGGREAPGMLSSSHFKRGDASERPALWFPPVHCLRRRIFLWESALVLLWLIKRRYTENVNHECYRQYSPQRMTYNLL